MVSVLLIVAGLTVLVLGGNYLVKGASGLAFKANIPPLVIGLTVVAMGTSAPELIVSLKAALAGSPDISIGNVVGSNIANIGLILALTALIAPVTVDRNIIRQDWPMMMIASMLFFILTTDGLLSFGEGLIMLITMIAFTVYLIIRSKWTTQPSIIENNETGADSYPKLIAYIIVGCIGLYFGAEWLVEGSVHVATKLGISEKVIGLSLVAVGTSIPELVASVIAAMKKQSDIALGNLIGSNIFNILGVLGLTSIIEPIQVSKEILSMDVFWMIGIGVILFPLMFFGARIGRLNGALLLACYIVYVTILFY
jgi:cation:H+ antiporter